MFKWLTKLFMKEKEENETSNMELKADQVAGDVAATISNNARPAPKKRKHKLEIQVYEADYEKADANNGQPQWRPVRSDPVLDGGRPNIIEVADKNELAEFAKGGRRRQTSSTPKRIVTFFDGCDQILPSDRLNVGAILFLSVGIRIDPALVKTEFLRLSVGFWQIGNDVILTFENTGTIVREIQNPARSTCNDDNIAGAQFHPCCIANALLNCLQKFRVGNAVTFALNNHKRFLAFII